MSKKSYASMSKSIKNADNFLRQYNNQLSRAYNQLGEGSNEYKNMIAFAEQSNMQLRTNSKGIVQISRSNANLQNYTNYHNNRNRSPLMNLKDKFYVNGKINSRIDVANKVQYRINMLNAQGITPNLKNIRNADKVESFMEKAFTNYHSFSSNFLGVKPVEYLEISERMTALSEYIQTDNYEGILRFIDENPDIRNAITEANKMASVKLDLEKIKKDTFHMSDIKDGDAF